MCVTKVNSDENDRESIENDLRALHDSGHIDPKAKEVLGYCLKNV